MYFQPLPAGALAGRINALTWPRVRPPRAQGDDPSAYEQLEKMRRPGTDKWRSISSGPTDGSLCGPKTGSDEAADQVAGAMRVQASCVPFVLVGPPVQPRAAPAAGPIADRMSWVPMGPGRGVRSSREIKPSVGHSPPRPSPCSGGASPREPLARISDWGGAVWRPDVSDADLGPAPSFVSSRAASSVAIAPFSCIGPELHPGETIGSGSNRMLPPPTSEVPPHILYKTRLSPRANFPKEGPAGAAAAAAAGAATLSARPRWPAKPDTTTRTVTSRNPERDAAARKTAASSALSSRGRPVGGAVAVPASSAVRVSGGYRHPISPRSAHGAIP